MAAPAVVGVGALAASVTTISPAWPAHAVDDIGILILECDAGETVSLTTANGFVACPSSPIASGGATGAGTILTAFWCRATSTSQAAPTTNDPGNHIQGLIFTISGAVTSGVPFDVSASAADIGSASTTTTWPTVTTTGADRLIVQIATRGNDSAAASWSAFTNAALASIVEHADTGTLEGNGGGLVVISGTKAVAGATGATTATVTSSRHAALTLAVSPIVSTAFSGSAALSGEATLTATGKPALPASAAFSGEATLSGVQSSAGINPSLIRKGAKADAQSSDTTVNPGYPASVVAGELLLLIYAKGDSLASLTGWVSVDEALDSTVANLQIFKRVADGTETGTLVVPNTSRSTAQIIAIPGASGTVTTSKNATTGTGVQFLVIPAITDVTGSVLIYAVGATLAADGFTGDVVAHTEIEDFGSVGRPGAIYRDNAVGGTGTRKVNVGGVLNRRIATVMVRVAPSVSGATAGSAAFSGEATLAATGSVPAVGSAAFSGSGELTASGLPAVAESAAFSGSGALSATGTTQAVIVGLVLRIGSVQQVIRIGSQPVAIRIGG